MIFHLSEYLVQYYSAFNVVHYVSFRAIASLLTALILSFIFGNWFIEKFRAITSSQTRQYTPESHKLKGSMPTMGGIFILWVVLVTTLLWNNLADPLVWLFLMCLYFFGLIGFWDDWSKINYKKGIPESKKIYAQVIAGLIVALSWFLLVNPSTAVTIPFFKNWYPDLGLLFIPWVVFVLVGTSNAVNLTDGLDGLAIGSLISNFATFSVICYLAGHIGIAHYLNIPFAGTAEIAVIGATLVGASLGFLWYNAYPAQIFMGDVGSLALGAGLAFMALLAKQELLLPLAGGLFMLETLSVMLQVFYYKRYKKRLFKMAPIHHHFELLGWQESKITVRFGIISLILCLLALLTLKLR